MDTGLVLDAPATEMTMSATCFDEKSHFRTDALPQPHVRCRGCVGVMLTPMHHVPSESLRLSSVLPRPFAQLVIQCQVANPPVHSRVVIVIREPACRKLSESRHPRLVCGWRSIPLTWLGGWTSLSRLWTYSRPFRAVLAVALL